MTLIATREEFCRRSGRHSLCTDFAGGDYTDNGADRFINAGQRYLDNKGSFLKAYAWLRKDIAINDYKLVFQDCQSIKEVWIQNADGRSQLDKMDLETLRNEYATAQGDMDSGTPVNYTPAVIGLAPGQATLTAAGGAAPYTDEFTYDYEDLTFGDHWRFNGILFMPPTDVVFTVSVLGRWYSLRMSTDAQMTFWTEVHEDILVLASLMMLERFYRNTQGVNDYKTEIIDSLNDIDKNVVEEEVQDLDQMEG